MMRRVLFFLALLLFPQIESSFGRSGEMVIAAPSAEVRIPAGGSAEAGITLTIREGLHIQANPLNDPFLIPATLEIFPAAAIVPGSPTYPPGDSFILKGSADTLLVYHGSVSIKFPLQALPSAQPGEYLLQGNLRYQACDSLRCFAPRTLSVTVPVTIIEGKEKVKGKK